MVGAVMGLWTKWFGPSEHSMLVSRLLDTLQSQHESQQRLVEQVVGTANEYVGLLKAQHKMLVDPVNISAPRLMTREDEARYEKYRSAQAKTKDAIVVDLDAFLDDFQRDPRIFGPESE